MTTTTAPVAPIVNLNGATQSSLIDQQRAILRACSALHDALAAASPHGRDFQISPPGDFEAAREQHAASFAACDQIRDQAMQISLQIMKQREGSRTVECEFCSGSGSIDLFISGDPAETITCPSCVDGWVEPSEHRKQINCLTAARKADADVQF